MLLSLLLGLLIITVFLLFLRLYKLLGKANVIADELSRQIIPEVNKKLNALNIEEMAKTMKIVSTISHAFSEIASFISLFKKKKKSGSETEM
ncbi:MAG: hypothetical protein DRP00_06030 [Candidatus Aenigmatarchaeota archaeon]|nr:MAG: hypothetical protein DRP00_06030 [Candidatus Aenigmarchaeota archaeon]